MTDDFFRNRLDLMIDLRHPLAVPAPTCQYFQAPNILSTIGHETRHNWSALAKPQVHAKLWAKKA
jgi:hypothetical protein